MRFMKKALAVILVFIQVISILPTNVHINVYAAASYDGTINLSSDALSSGSGWSRSGETYTINGDVLVVGASGSRRIAISGGTAASPRRVTLQNVSMSPAQLRPLNCIQEYTLL